MFLRTCAFLLCSSFFVSTVSAQGGSSMPQFKHVFVLVEENTNYDSVVGSGSMPYFNSLANQYGLATNFYANTHPSLGNYFVMTTGEVVSNDTNFACAVTVDNLVRQFVKAGKTWRVYAESLPSVGYTGGDVYPYAKHHNPFVYFSDVLNSSAQKLNVVPFTQLASDLSSGTLPDFAFIVPNLQSDIHDCPPGMTSCTLNDKLAYGDQWLQNNIAPLISNPAFQQDGLLIITFDEAGATDSSFGGGKVATIVVSPKAKPGYRSNTFYQHEHLLRSVLAAMGMNSFMGASKWAGDMAEFFQSGGSGSISGNVTDSVTGAAIAGAAISGPGSTTTDPTGNYQFASVAAGTYVLTASASGYQNSSGTVTVSNGANSTQNFTLAPATSGSFGGKVTSAVDGRAIAGATVSYSGGSTTTDTSGIYSFATVAPGTYPVAATKTGWGKVTRNVTVSTGAAATLNFQLATSGQIKGTVTNSSGGAIAGASVTITGGVLSTTKSLTTSLSGAYSSGWIPVGNYTITVQSGSLSKTQNVTLGTGQILTVNFTLP